jgi:ribosomal-protein-alanine N-acetyltransferase
MVRTNGACGAFPALETERLRLTAMTPGDARDLFGLLSDPAVTRYMGMAPLEELLEAADLLRVFGERAAAGVELRWAIRPRGEAELIGVCTLDEPYSARRRAELGYVVARSHWRQGIAAEAVRAVLAHAFGPLGLNRVEALVYAEHVASRALLAKLGFVQEGVLRQHAWEKGRYWDDVVYALLAQEYAARAHAP